MCLKKLEPKGYKTPILFRVPNKLIAFVGLVVDGFSYDIASHGYGLLGQKGFFENFTVKFDYSKSDIELKPKH